MRPQPLSRIDVEAGDGRGVLLGDLLDVDAALGRHHAQVLLGGAIEQSASVATHAGVSVRSDGGQAGRPRLGYWIGAASACVVVAVVVGAEVHLPILALQDAEERAVGIDPILEVSPLPAPRHASGATTARRDACTRPPRPCTPIGPRIQAIRTEPGRRPEHRRRRLPRPSCRGLGPAPAGRPRFGLLRRGAPPRIPA